MFLSESRTKLEAPPHFLEKIMGTLPSSTRKKNPKAICSIQKYFLKIE